MLTKMLLAASVFFIAGCDEKLKLVYITDADLAAASRAGHNTHNPYGSWLPCDEDNMRRLQQEFDARLRSRGVTVEWVGRDDASDYFVQVRCDHDTGSEWVMSLILMGVGPAGPDDKFGMYPSSDHPLGFRDRASFHRWIDAQLAERL